MRSLKEWEVGKVEGETQLGQGEIERKASSEVKCMMLRGAAGARRFHCKGSFGRCILD